MSIEAMKQAVEAFEHIKKYVTDDGAMPENWDAYHEKEYFALEALRQAIEQAEKWDTSDMAHRSGGLSVEQAEKQEPKAWIYEGNLHIFDPTDWAIEPESVQPLYTAPVKREWVGLTDEEMTKIASKTLTFKQFVEIIEAELKEKNT
jgi:hypothetical protein